MSTPRQDQLWIVANLGLGEKFVDHATLHLDAALAAFPRVSLIPTENLLGMVDNRSLEGVTAVFLDKDIALASLLEAQGAQVTNSARTIALCDDKRLTAVALTHAGLATPKTVLLPALYPKQQLSSAARDALLAMIGLPLVLKEARGSFGSQVYLATNREDFDTLTDALSDRHLLAQAFIESSRGTDLRLQVVGDTVVAAMRRHNEIDFRANLTNGGIGTPYTPSEQETALAVAATHAVGAVTAGVDLLLDGDGQGSMVCEVNSNAHIRRLFEITGINAAEHLMHHLARH
ncbi:MAG: ATP-grasp domain-containing protein [Ferrimicrobium sp.]